MCKATNLEKYLNNINYIKVMVIRTIKKAKIRKLGKEYIVIECSGSTKLNEIMKKYGKKYYPSLTQPVKKRNGLYEQILFKREKELKSNEDMYDW
jgi:hypothetical protein